jgi:hypothetical protein
MMKIMRLLKDLTDLNGCQLTKGNQMKNINVEKIGANDKRLRITFKHNGRTLQIIGYDCLPLWVEKEKRISWAEFHHFVTEPENE